VRYIPDKTVMFTGSLQGLLRQVPELMLMPKQAREQLPSLLVAQPAIPPESWAALWFGISSSTLAATLNAAELGLQVKAVYHSGNSNLYIHRVPGEQALGFLTTGQGSALFVQYHSKS